jgi:nitrous oxidase accessory protein
VERSKTKVKKINRNLQNLTLKNILFFFILFILVFVEYSYAVEIQKPQASELRVCSTCAMSSIASAIALLATNGTITVQKGHYKEGASIEINKPLTLRGEAGAIIDGEEKYQVITILKTSDVTIEGFEIRNGGASFIQDLAGLKSIECQNCKIINNYFFNTTYAIYLEKSENCLVKNNKIESDAVEEVNSGNGIHVWTGSGNVIEGNSVSGHRDGIYLEFAKNNLIKNNKIKKNIRYGLHFMQSNDTLYQKNIFSENGAGVAVMYSTKIRMVENEFSNNSGPSSYGLLLKDITDSLILRNEFINNTVGIYMEGTNRSEFKSNQIRENGWGLKIMGNCENDEFRKNNFIGNTFEVVTNASHSWNTFENNYWSQYDGFDLNGDGFGDKPHRPISLSSIILEKVDSAYILLNSFFFRLLDEVERALPEMITDELMDKAPMMKETSAL